MNAPRALVRATLATAALFALATAAGTFEWWAPAAAAAAATPNAQPDASSQPKSVPGLEVKEAWIRWLPAGLPAGGFLTLANRSDRPLVLTSASSSAYAEIGLHRTLRQGEMGKMIMVASITIPARGSVDFAAEGYHLMLMQPTRAISPGEQVPITLHFSGGQAQTVEFQVRQPSSTSGHGHENMSGMSGMPGMPH